jgi:hypothetical protein
VGESKRFFFTAQDVSKEDDALIVENSVNNFFIINRFKCFPKIIMSKG